MSGETGRGGPARRVAARRRARWLAKRERGGRLRPLPTPVIAGNAMSVSTGKAHAVDIFWAYLEQMVEHGAVALGCTECADFDAALVVRRFNNQHGTRLRAYQYGDPGSPESGTALVVDLARFTPHTEQADLILGSPAGQGVRARSMVSMVGTIDAGTLHAWTLPVTAGHAPPSWAARMRGVFVRRIRTRRGVRLGDMNLTRRVLARLMPDVVVRSVGVLAAMVPAWIPCGPAKPIPKHKLKGADHAGDLVTLWP